MDFGEAGPSMPGPNPNLPLVDLLWLQWEQELAVLMGGSQHDNEGILSFLCRVNQVYRNTICVALWGLPEKQVLFARKHMNDIWRERTEALMWDMTMRFNYGNFIRMIERQATDWEPCVMPDDPTGIGIFPTALPSEAVIWGATETMEVLPLNPLSSASSNEDLSQLADEATSRAMGDAASATS